MGELFWHLVRKWAVSTDVYYRLEHSLQTALNVVNALERDVALAVENGARLEMLLAKEKRYSLHFHGKVAISGEYHLLVSRLLSVSAQIADTPGARRELVSEVAKLALALNEQRNVVATDGSKPHG